MFTSSDFGAKSTTARQANSFKLSAAPDTGSGIQRETPASPQQTRPLDCISAYDTARHFWPRFGPCDLPGATRRFSGNQGPVEFSDCDSERSSRIDRCLGKVLPD